MDALSSAMLTMYCNDGSYNRAAIAAQIRENYSSQAVAFRLMQEYQQLIGAEKRELEKAFA